MKGVQEFFVLPLQLSLSLKFVKAEGQRQPAWGGRCAAHTAAQAGQEPQSSSVSPAPRAWLRGWVAIFPVPCLPGTWTHVQPTPCHGVPEG